MICLRGLCGSEEEAPVLDYSRGGGGTLTALAPMQGASGVSDARDGILSRLS